MIFQLSSYNLHLTPTLPKDLMLPSAQKDGKLHSNKLPKGRKQNPPALHEEDDDVQKKLMHRDIERQRRQEMTTLYASLRSLLPLEYIKGKRSISDHMNEAVKYIKFLQNRIKELDAKRDKLRKLSNLNAVDPEIRSSTSCADPPTNVTVRHCLGGVEVVFSSSLTAQMLPLSRLVDMLRKDGFTIANCIYTKVEQRLIYSIHLEVNSDPTSIDPSVLKRKVTELATPSSSNSSL